jgi:outer membrane protein TolC
MACLGLVAALAPAAAATPEAAPAATPMAAVAPAGDADTNVAPATTRPVAVSAPDTAWTLARAEQAALAVSPALAGARASAASARAAADAAGADLYPILGVTGQASYTTETMSVAIPTPTGTRHLEFGDGSNTDLMLGIRAPIYAGGALRAESHGAKARWQASLADLAADSLDLRLQVRLAFYSALGSQAAAEAARQGEARLRRHLANIESDIAAGMATEEARLQVLARLRRTEQATLQAEADAAARRYGLGRLVGRPGVQIVPAAELDRPLGGDASDTTSWVERPWDERPELIALDARITAADESRRAAAGSYWPAIDVEGGWHYGRPGVDVITNDWMDYGTVALTLRWTLFDFGGRGGRVSSLRARTRALAAARNDLDDALRTRLANARTQLEAARLKAARATERLDLEQQRLRLTHERWRAGHATESELLDAQDDTTVAATDLAAARAGLRMAEAELLAALGW